MNKSKAYAYTSFKIPKIYSLVIIKNKSEFSNLT